MDAQGKNRHGGPANGEQGNQETEKTHTALTLPKGGFEKGTAQRLAHRIQPGHLSVLQEINLSPYLPFRPIC